MRVNEGENLGILTVYLMMQPRMKHKRTPALTVMFSSMILFNFLPMNLMKAYAIVTNIKAMKNQNAPQKGSLPMHNTIFITSVATVPRELTG